MFDAWIKQGGEIHYIAVETFPIKHPKIFPHLLWTPFKKREGLFFWTYFILTSPVYAFFIAFRYQINLVSVFSGIYGFLSLPIKVILGKPLIALARADVLEISRLHHRFILRIFFEEILMAIGFKSANRVVTVSKQLRHIMISRYRIKPEKIEVLYNDIRDISMLDDEKRLCRRKMGLDEQAFVILTAAVLDPRKNIAILLKALPLLKTPCVVLVVGDGQERTNLEALSQKIKGKTNIIFTGWQEEVSPYFKAADLFVFPSRHEGCPNALLEALSYRLPCIGSDIPEIRELLKSDHLLFDPQDVTNLSDKINHVMLDKRYLGRVRELSDEVRKAFIFDWDEKIVDIHKASLS